MADRCYVQITLRQKDLDRFGSFLLSAPHTTWWDEHICDPAQGIVAVGIHQAKDAIYDEREKAARAGIAFFGDHGEGGEYAASSFASLDGEQLEVDTDRDGLLCVQLDRNMNVLTDLGHIREYLDKLHRVEQLFGIQRDTSGVKAADARDLKLGEHYLLHIIGDVEPGLHGPYPTELLRDETARRIRLGYGDRDGLYRLDMTDQGTPVVSPYGSAELEQDQAA